MTTTDYYRDGANWDAEVHRAHRANASLWRRVAMVAMGVIALQALGFAFLLPLKERVPYAITVDPSTGRATATHLVASGPLTQEEGVVRSWVGQYVIQRETYDLYDGQARYDAVMQMSVGQAAQSYADLWRPENPDYPYKVFGRDGKVSVSVASISLLNERTASVQFVKTEAQPGKGALRSDWTAIVGFEFIQAGERSIMDVIQNPVGFRVKSWRADAVFRGE